ncbi:MAG: hypothetical protein SNJ29_10255 [Rikenellaceae bacterium]
MNIIKKADRCIEGILLIGCMPSFIILICIIGLFRSCIGYDEISIDNSYMKNRYEYERVNIYDSLGNGYECLFFTTEAVTEARYDELSNRKHIRDSYKRFKECAADHFSQNLINTDIYDFVEYAKTFDVAPDTVRLVNVWAIGSGYLKLYQRPHPTNPKEWGWRDGDKEEFGGVYIKENEIYPYNPDAGRTYRYWKCDQTSSEDERYTHIYPWDR